MCLIAIAIAMVSAVPVDETNIGEAFGQQDTYSPYQQSEFFKLKKLKKLLFGWIDWIESSRSFYWMAVKYIKSIYPKQIFKMHSIKLY